MEDVISNQIKQRLEEYYEAFHIKDWEKFSSILDERFKYFTDGANVLDKPGFVEFLKKDPWQGIEYNISNLEIHTSAAQDFVLILYKIFFKGHVNNTEHTVNAIESTIFTRESGDWKIIHCHSSNKG